MKSLILTLFICIFSLNAAEVIPGLIPRYYSISSASDLEVKPEIAHAMAMSGEDISLIEPERGTNIFDENKSEISVDELISNDSVEFHSLLSSRLGNVRFTIKDSEGELYNVYLSKKNHNYLLRKNILEKLGYHVPKMQWMSSLNLNFASTIEKDLFKEEMKDELLADIQRWIVSENSNFLKIQDVIVMPAKNDIYNLALGLMPSSIHRGRRLLRAPYVAISLVDTPESVNLFSWNAGRIILNQIKLFHTNDIENTYSTSFEDAKWLGRRIARLNRDDIEEVVRAAFFPKSVELLLIEKIIQRRNNLITLLQLENEFESLPFNSNISFGEDLVKGEITQEFFEGYASRFSFGDPESPFSNSELSNYVLSRAQSEIINSGISRFNKLLATNTEQLYIDKLKEIIKKDGIFFPAQGILVPMASGSVILSRDIVTGSYMGTNNKVQLVDNLGFNMEAGALYGIEGLPLPLTFKASGGVAFQRMFSHVKPIQSLKKAMKEPYKNMAIPLLIKDLANKINKLSLINDDNNSLVIASIIGDLKKTLGVGESFIITDSITAKLSAQLGVSISAYMTMDERLLKVYAQLNAAKMQISRMHIHRKDEDTIHIYEDDGSSLRLALSVKLNVLVPVLGVQARWHKAKAQTQFFPLSLKSSDVNVTMLKALRKSLLSLNTESLKSIMNPHVINHDLGEFGSTLNFLFFKRNKIQSNHSISIKHQAGGDEKKIYRRYDAKTKGRDFEGYFTEVINDILANIIKKDISISQTQVINPGFTVAGKAKNKIFISETDGEKIHSEYRRILNGWSIGRGKLTSYLKQLNSEFGSDVFSPYEYQNTNLIMLYQLQLTMKVEDYGINKILDLSVNSIEKLIKKYATGHIRDPKVLARNLKRRLNKVKINLANYPKFAFKKWHDFLDDFIELVKFKGLIEAAGKENIVAYGRVDGFRSGDEAGDNPILSDIYGELPTQIHPSLTQEVQQKIGIIEGELLAGWLMERAI